MLSNSQIILRLLLSAFLGGLVGIEREASKRPAGFRTHVLVTLGSTLIMMISIDAFTRIGAGEALGDPARLAAQVVSGIGFLGAGTILHNGTNIKGLTTAASLWVCGGIGLAIGSGYYLGAIVTVVIVLFALMKLTGIERNLLKNNYKIMIVNCIERSGLICELTTILRSYGVDIRDIKITREDENSECGNVEMEFVIKAPSNFLDSDLIQQISNIKYVKKARWKI